MSTVLYEKRNRVAYVTINRPDVMNCVDAATAGALVQAWEDFRDDDDAFVAVITGAGDRAFCAGADLKSAAMVGVTDQARSPDRDRRLQYGRSRWIPARRRCECCRPAARNELRSATC